MDREIGQGQVSTGEQPINKRILISLLLITAVGEAALGLVAVNTVAKQGNAIVYGIVLLIGCGLTLVTLALAWFGLTLPGRILTPLSLLVIVDYIAFSTLGLHDVAIYAFPLVLVVGILLLGERALYYFLPFIIVSIVFLGYADLSGLNDNPIRDYTGVDDIFIISILTIMIVVMFRLLVRRLNETIRKSQENEIILSERNKESQELSKNLEKRVTDRTAQLKAINEVGRVTSSILNPEELMKKTVNLISDNFGDYYYAAFYLVDPTGRWAQLVIASGITGKTIKKQEQRLEIGEGNIIGSVIKIGRAQIAPEINPETAQVNNPLLPDTKSEIALPLIVGGKVIGALDVQSTQVKVFDEGSTETLQSLANQVAITLDNARLFQETQNSLDELRTTQRFYSTEAWSEKAQEHKGFEYISGNIQTAPDQDTTPLIVPLTLREQIIGQLSLEGLQTWTPEERGLIEAVATQTALALENARLLEESQQLALRERLIAEITGKIWSSPNVDIILQTAIKELGRALRADAATIELKLD